MFLKRSCTCPHCYRSFECTGAFGPNGARYINGAVAWMKLLSRESGRLLLEGNTLCTACAGSHRFLVEYDSVTDRYIDIDPDQSAARAKTSEPPASQKGIGRVLSGPIRKLQRI